MTVYVVDCSVALKWFIPEEHSDRAAALLDERWALIAPELMVPEFGNVVWKKVRRGELRRAEAAAVVEAFRAVPIELVPGLALIGAALDLALDHGRTVYDASYVALAAAREATLITADERLARAFAGARWGRRVVALSSFVPGLE